MSVPLLRSAALTLALLPLAALGACKARQAPEDTASATPQSTDFTVENPTEPAVPVNLPTTDMSGPPATPASSLSPSPAASGAK